MRVSRTAALLGLVFVLAQASTARAAFPGANGRIAYALTGQPGGPQGSGLVTIGADGSGPAAAGSGGQADWSPDGRRLALVLGHGLYVQAADGSHRRRVKLGALGRYPQGPSAPRWTADGRHVLFLSYTPGEEPRAALFRVRSDGRDRQLVRRFARNTYVAFAPSPDGRRIAFSQLVRRLRAPVLFAMPSAGGHARLLATLGVGTEWPGRIDWSPDGTRIVFDGSGIQIVQADGSGVATLTPDGRRPAFSPDGRDVAFVRFTDMRSSGSYPTAIDVVEADGSGRRTLLTDDRGVTSPTWQPLPTS